MLLNDVEEEPPPEEPSPEGVGEVWSPRDFLMESSAALLRIMKHETPSALESQLVRGAPPTFSPLTTLPLTNAEAEEEEEADADEEESPRMARRFAVIGVAQCGPDRVMTPVTGSKDSIRNVVILRFFFGIIASPDSASTIAHSLSHSNPR